MSIQHLSLDELIAGLSARPSALDVTPGEPNVVVVHQPAGADSPDPPGLPSSLPAVVLGIVDDADLPAPPWCDVAVASASPLLDAAVTTVEENPTAATALVQLLRHSERRSMTDGLLLESAVYSALQAGPEFLRWRGAYVRRRRPRPSGPPVVIDRHDDQLTITLNRPHVRNALDTTMRNGLLEALDLALEDASIDHVELRGAGVAYSAGGDLDEFGQFPDPASAHLIRTTLAIGPKLAALGDRLRVRLHGTCAGSGIELPAFAAHVTAAPDTICSLPELRLGLIPGAGGTWSVPRRIGRHRTALLALTHIAIDATTAARWGLVDAVTA